MKFSLAMVLGSCLLTSVAFAEEAATEAPKATPVKISGFVDTSINIPIDGYEGEDRKVAFGLDQVEVDFEAAPAAGFVVRADLNIFPSTDAISFADLLEQAFLEYHFNGGDDGFFLKIGKANAPIGSEALDPVDMYQYSQGLLFTNTAPSNLTGLFAGYGTGGVTATVWATNDWDAPKKADKPNVGGRLEYSFEEGHVAVCSTYEPIKVPDSLGRLMVDADLSYKMGALTAFAETNYGSLDETASTGFMGKLNYALTDGESFTVRWDYLDSDMVDNTFDEAMSGAFAFLFTINDNLIGAAEIKTDFEASERTTTSGAVELIGSF